MTSRVEIFVSEAVRSVAVAWVDEWVDTVGVEAVLVEADLAEEDLAADFVLWLLEDLVL